MSIRATAPGHPSVTQEVEVKRDRIVFLQFRLPSVAAVLAELVVVVSGDRSRISDPRTAEDLLMLQIPSARGWRSGNIGKNDFVINLRGTGSLTQSAEPLVLIDGALVSKGESTLDALAQIPASDVLNIQVLRGPAAAFLYLLAANGVILVTTRSGR